MAQVTYYVALPFPPASPKNTATHSRLVRPRQFCPAIRMTAAPWRLSDRRSSARGV